MIHLTVEKVAERVTDGVAVGAVTSPLWLESLSKVSDFATWLLPIMGCIWLGHQMVALWARRNEEKARALGNVQGRKEVAEEAQQLLDKGNDK